MITITLLEILQWKTDLEKQIGNDATIQLKGGFASLFGNTPTLRLQVDWPNDLHYTQEFTIEHLTHNLNEKDFIAYQVRRIQHAYAIHDETRVTDGGMEGATKGKTI